MTITNKQLTILIVLVVLIAIFTGFYKYHLKHANDYSVVYMTTGEIYVGHLTTFPDLELKDGYILQMIKDVTDPTKNNFQLQPINKTIWAPDALHFNKNNIIFYGTVLPTSKIYETLATIK